MARCGRSIRTISASPPSAPAERTGERRSEEHGYDDYTAEFPSADECGWAAILFGCIAWGVCMFPSAHECGWAAI
jgi:hypothetical protein